MTWPDALARLRTFPKLSNGWDGAGSVAPSSTHISAAERLALKLWSKDEPAPNRVWVGTSGEIYFEWVNDGGVKEIEVTSAVEYEIFCSYADKPATLAEVRF